ncbi:Amidase 1 [Tetrabaena socialis]|uniref:Amidase 1 n=1 Tax=Tetrabaena socialis TaxID=47790 RepID=A0A2J8AAD5_9CHLO|nr:Amidase 1 [Tetrabaena socialis]|eukprot:PNH09482.1 Amidase 1 [Tetrabaena socialis]
MDRTTLGCTVCWDLVLLALCGSLAASRQLLEASTASASTRTLVYPMPSHVVKMTDKLHVQKWIDASRDEIARSGVHVEASCDERFGQGYLDKWQAAKKDVCLSGTSTFTCYEHPHNDRGNNLGSLFCAVDNLVLDSADFLGDVLTRPEAKVPTGGAKYPNPKRGSARVACELAQPLPWSREQGFEVWREHGAWVTEHRPEFGPGIKERFAMAAAITPEQLAAANIQRAALRAHVVSLLGPDGVIALPTTPGPAPPVNTPPAQLDAWRTRLISLTSIAGLAGLPQVHLPLARVDGLPVGLGLIGPPGSDEALLELTEGLAGLLLPGAEA